MHTRLRHAGIPCERFMRWRLRYMNLRNHRKILVVDGKIGFTGGMNFREGNLLRLQPPCHSPIRDIQFKLRGPIVAQLQQTFTEDWRFSCGETLSGEQWFPDLEHSAAAVRARGIPDGPDEDFETFRFTLLGALTAAQRRVRIMTPYFLPDGALITVLNVMAMHGVSVDIVLPAKGNLPLVQWASTALLWQLLERGCRIWLTPPPFDHSKLMLVDDEWTLFGSANWDSRSIRLNFEFNVECYDRELTATVDALIQSRIDRARQLTFTDVESRPLLVKLRDGIARLATPYL